MCPNQNKYAQIAQIQKQNTQNPHFFFHSLNNIISSEMSIATPPPPPPVDLLPSPSAVHGDNPNAVNVGGGSGSTSYSDLWDKFPEVIEKLKRTRSGMKDLHTIFKNQCDAHKEIAKVYSKSRLDSTGMGSVIHIFIIFFLYILFLNSVI